MTQETLNKAKTLEQELHRIGCFWGIVKLIIILDSSKRKME